MFDGKNCTYTTGAGVDKKTSLAEIVEIMSTIKEPPKIFVMDMKAMRSEVLTGNTIILGTDVADALEAAMGDNDGKI